MKKYRTGISGSAHINSHLYSLNAVPNIELVAAVAQTEAEKRLFQSYGISTFYQNYKEMLDNENLDIFEIDSAPNLRYEMTLEAAKRGIHVLGKNRSPCLSKLVMKWSMHAKRLAFSLPYTTYDAATLIIFERRNS